MGDCIPRLRQPIKEVERRCPLTQPIPEGLQPACYRRGRQRHGGARPTAAAGGRGKEGPRRGSALRLSRQRPSLQSGLWPGCGTPAGPRGKLCSLGEVRAPAFQLPRPTPECSGSVSAGRPGLAGETGTNAFGLGSGTDFRIRTREAPPLSSLLFASTLLGVAEALEDFADSEN